MPFSPAAIAAPPLSSDNRYGTWCPICSANFDSKLRISASLAYVATGIEPTTSSTTPAVISRPMPTRQWSSCTARASRGTPVSRANEIAIGTNSARHAKPSTSSTTNPWWVCGVATPSALAMPRFGSHASVSAQIASSSGGPSTTTFISVDARIDANNVRIE